MWWCIWIVSFMVSHIYIEHNGPIMKWYLWSILHITCVYNGKREINSMAFPHCDWSKSNFFDTCIWKLCSVTCEIVWCYFGRHIERSHCQNVYKWLCPHNPLNPLNIRNSFMFRPQGIVFVVTPWHWHVLASCILPVGMVEFYSVKPKVVGKVDEIIEIESLFLWYTSQFYVTLRIRWYYLMTCPLIYSACSCLRIEGCGCTNNVNCDYCRLTIAVLSLDKH